MAATASTNFFAQMSGAVTSIGAGTCVCEDSSGRYVAATTAALSYAGRVAGVAVTSATSANLTFQLQTDGVVAASITGLGTGLAGPVTCNAVGALVRTAAPTTGDWVMGTVDPLGDIVLSIGTYQPYPAPTSPGGSTTQIQRNNAGAFGAVSGVTSAGVFMAFASSSGQIRYADGGFTSRWDCTPTSNKVLTFPDVTDTVAVIASAQTLTNKTIVAASNTITDTSAALGDLLVHNGTRFVRLALGANGYVLSSNGSTAVWAALSVAVGSIAGLGTNVATWLATPSGANLASALTTALPDSKGGTGLTALGTNVGVWLGTPSGANLASALTTALPDSKGGTGLTALGSGVATFLGTPSGANLASALTTALPDSKGGTGLTSLASGIATFLGSPSGANLASALTTALPESKGGTGLTAFGSGVATFLATPSGANLASALTTALPESKGGTGLTSLGTNVGVFLGTPSGANLAAALTTALPVSKGGTNRTALGSALQVLRTNAGATDTEWAAASGGTSVSEVTSASTGNLDDFNASVVDGAAIFLNFSGTAVVIRGILAPTTGSATVIAYCAAGISATNSSGTSLAANRVINYAVGLYYTIALYYSPSLANWVITNCY